jgi:hypothetical protein
MSPISHTADLDAGDRITRRSPRVWEPGLRGRLPVAARAALVDISMGGAGVQASVPLLPSISYRVRLDGGQQSVERIGRLIWRRDDVRATSPSKARVFRCGLAFEAHGGKESNGDLYDFINGHQPEQLDEPSSIVTLGPERTASRYRLGAVSDITLETEIPYRVMTISLSGMLIASTVPLRAQALIVTLLELPKAEIRTAARVVACERFDDPTHCKVALELCDMSPEDQRILGDYLQPLLN